MLFRREQQGVRALSLILSLALTITLVSGLSYSEEPAGQDGGGTADRLDQVEKILRDWLKIHQEDRTARYRLAQVLSRQGKLDEAVNEYNRLLEKSGEDSSELLAKAEELFENDCQAEALLYLRKLMRLSPRNREIYEQKIKAWRRRIAREQLEENVPAVPVESPGDVAKQIATAQPPDTGDFLLHSIKTLQDNIKTLQDNNRPLHALLLLRKFRAMNPRNNERYRRRLDLWRETLGRQLVTGAEPVAASEPMAEEPMAEEPMAEEPMAEEPMAEEPMAEEPMAEEPAAEEPAAARKARISSLIDQLKYRAEHIEPEPVRDVPEKADIPPAAEKPEIVYHDGDRIQQAWELLFSGRFTEARNLYQVIVQERPDDMEALQGLASAHRYLGDYEQGIAIAETLLALDPYNIDVLVEMAIMCNYLNRNKSALRYLRAAAKIDPVRPDIVAMLHQLNNWYDTLDQELIDVNKRLALQRDDVGGYIDLGRVPGWRDTLAEAEYRYRLVLDEQPDNLEALLGLGRIHLRRGRWKKAEVLFRQARDIYPGNPEAAEALARLAAAREPMLETQYHVYEQDDYSIARQSFAYKIAQTTKALYYTHPLSPATSLTVRSLQSDARRDFTPTQQRELHVDIDTVSLGGRHRLTNGIQSRFRLDSSRFSNNGNYHYNLPGRVDDTGGFIVLEKDFSRQLLTAAYSRSLYLESRPGPFGMSDVASIEAYTLAYDVDLLPELSSLAAVEKAYYSTQEDTRNSYRLRLRYRLPVKESVQLQYEYRSASRPEETERTVFLNVRDRLSDRLRYLVDYNVSFKNISATRVETHSTGLLLDYEFRPELTWYVDSRYTYEREDALDEIFFYHTGVRLVF